MQTRRQSRSSSYSLYARKFSTCTESTCTHTFNNSLQLKRSSSSPAATSLLSLSPLCVHVSLITPSTTTPPPPPPTPPPSATTPTTTLTTSQATVCRRQSCRLEINRHRDRQTQSRRYGQRQLQHQQVSLKRHPR